MNQALRFSWIALTALSTALLTSGCTKLPEPVTSGAAASAGTSTSAGTATASGTATQVSDMDVTEHVQTALRQKESLQAYDIAVVTLKGDVRLIGTLDTQAQIDEAIQIARSAEGAHAVHDELLLKQ